MFSEAIRLDFAVAGVEVVPGPRNTTAHNGRDGKRAVSALHDYNYILFGSVSFESLATSIACFQNIRQRICGTYQILW